MWIWLAGGNSFPRFEFDWPAAIRFRAMAPCDRRRARTRNCAAKWNFDNKTWNFDQTLILYTCLIFIRRILEKIAGVSPTRWISWMLDLAPFCPGILFEADYWKIKPRTEVYWHLLALNRNVIHHLNRFLWGSNCTFLTNALCFTISALFGWVLNFGAEFCNHMIPYRYAGPYSALSLTWGSAGTNA